MSGVADEKVFFTKAELEKLAQFIAETGKTIKQATEIGKNLLEDNEKISAEIEAMKAEKHAAERTSTINKIAEMLNQHGFISKSAMSQKVEELNKMTDEALYQLKDTVQGLSGTPGEKYAAEGMFSTFDFLDSSLYNEIVNDGKPRPLSLG